MNEQAGPVIPLGAIPAHQKPQREINPTAPPMGTARQAVGQPLAQVGHKSTAGPGRRPPPGAAPRAASPSTSTGGSPAT